MQYNKGQEAIEFILITTLVFFGSLMVVLVFGNKIANFFTNDSSAIKAANASPTIISASNPVKYTPDYTTTDNTKTSYQTAAEEASAAAAAAAASAQKTSSGGTPYTINTDGSVSFSVAGQNVLLSSDIVQLQDIVMETSGSEGATSLVDEIAYMINKYKAQYPNGNVPVDISFGTGNRVSATGNSAYLGNTSANSVSLKVGDQFVIIQNDQICNSKNTYSENTCSFQGTYRMEGTIGSDNSIKTSNVNATTIYENNYTGSFNGSAISSNGLTVSGDYYLQYGYQNVQYKWDIKFDNPDYSFVI
ncbi:MAG: hypothetical protein AB1782_16165 [Cyanobacteriota bacterium]